MKCPKCQTENVDDANFCNACGANLLNPDDDTGIDLSGLDRIVDSSYVPPKMNSRTGQTQILPRIEEKSSRSFRVGLTKREERARRKSEKKEKKEQERRERELEKQGAQSIKGTITPVGGSIDSQEDAAHDTAKEGVENAPDNHLASASADKTPSHKASDRKEAHDVTANEKTSHKEILEGLPSTIPASEAKTVPAKADEQSKPNKTRLQNLPEISDEVDLADPLKNADPTETETSAAKQDAIDTEESATKHDAAKAEKTTADHDAEKASGAAVKPEASEKSQQAEPSGATEKPDVAKASEKTNETNRQQVSNKPREDKTASADESFEDAKGQNDAEGSATSGEAGITSQPKKEAGAEKAPQLTHVDISSKTDADIPGKTEQDKTSEKLREHSNSRPHHDDQASSPSRAEDQILPDGIDDDAKTEIAEDRNEAQEARDSRGAQVPQEPTGQSALRQDEDRSKSDKAHEAADTIRTLEEKPELAKQESSEAKASEKTSDIEEKDKALDEVGDSEASEITTDHGENKKTDGAEELGPADALTSAEDVLADGNVSQTEVEATATRSSRTIWITVGVIAAVIVIALIIVGATYAAELWGGKSIPNVDGLPRAEAVGKLEDKGFDVTVVEVKTDAEDGTAIETEPAAGVRTDNNSNVVLRIADTRRIPNIVGLEEGEAAQLLADEGYTNISYSYTKDNGAEENCILSVTPVEGTKAGQGDLIAVEVAEAYVVPDISGMSAEEASSLLESEGYVVTTTQVDDDNAADGTALRSEPEAGSKCDPGETVTLYVARDRSATLIARARAFFEDPTIMRIGSDTYEIVRINSITYIGNGACAFSVVFRPYGYSDSPSNNETITGQISFNADNSIRTIDPAMRQIS